MCRIQPTKWWTVAVRLFEACLIGFTNMLNELNLELQGEDKPWSLWSAQSMLWNDACHICLQSFSAMIQQTSRTWHQSLRCKESCVCTLTVQATQSRVWQMLYLSHSLRSCDSLFRKMLRLLHSRQRLQHWFTWTLLECRMRHGHCKPTVNWGLELMDSSEA